MFENINREYHLYRSLITARISLKSTLECGLDCDIAQHHARTQVRTGAHQGREKEDEDITKQQKEQDDVESKDDAMASPLARFLISLVKVDTRKLFTLVSRRGVLCTHKR